MANWCSSKITFEGDSVTIRKFLNDIRTVYPREAKGEEALFLGKILTFYHYNYNSYDCGGYITYIEDPAEESDHFEIRMRSVWGPAVDMWRTILRKRYPSITIYYTAEEPLMGVYQKWDKEGKYYPDNFILGFEDYENILGFNYNKWERFSSCESLIDKINKITNNGFTKLDEIEDYFDALYEAHRGKDIDLRIAVFRQVAA